MFALLSLALFACDKGIREEAIDAENILGRWRAVEEPDYDWDDSDDDGACDVPMYLGIMTFEHDGRGVADNVKEDNRLLGRFILMFEAAFRSP